jgi:hypothetical protein
VGDWGVEARWLRLVSGLQRDLANSAILALGHKTSVESLAYWRYRPTLWKGRIWRVCSIRVDGREARVGDWVSLWGAGMPELRWSCGSARLGHDGWRSIFLTALEVVVMRRDACGRHQLRHYRRLRRDWCLLGAVTWLRLLQRRLRVAFLGLIRRSSRGSHTGLRRLLAWNRRWRLLGADRSSTSWDVRIDRLDRNRGRPTWTNTLLGPHLLLLLHHPGVEHLSRRESETLHRGGHKVRGRCRGHASFSMHVTIAAWDRDLGILRLTDSAAHLVHHVWERELPKLLGLARSRILLCAGRLVLPGRDGLPLRLDRQTRTLLLDKERLGPGHLGPERLRPCELRSKRLRSCQLGPQRLWTSHLRLERLHRRRHVLSVLRLGLRLCLRKTVLGLGLLRFSSPEIEK